MSHLQVFPQDPKNPAGALRVWNAPEQRWELEDADDAAVLELMGAAAVERAQSAGVKAIAAARRENPAPLVAPKTKKPAS